MGTHPIFESDFDCLTECCLVEFHKSPELLSDTVPLVLQSTQLLWLIVPGSQTSKESSTLLVFASSFTLDQPPTTLANKLWDRFHEIILLCLKPLSEPSYLNPISIIEFKFSQLKK